MLIAVAGVGFCLSLPISGLGVKDKYENLLPPKSYMPPSQADERDIRLLKDEVEKERHKAGLYQNELKDEKEYSRFLLGEVQKYKILAGLTAMRGPGIIITLSESRDPTPPTWDPEALLIHHEDLLKIINELWQNKAEAIAIGSGSGRYVERITTFSPITCSGGAIIVNDQRMVPPFEIRAIGDPELLKSVLEMRGGYLEKLGAFNINVMIQTSDAVEIPAYSGSTLSLYSHAIIGDEEKSLPDEKGGSE
jgi:uncharacterized protein YlxW (UPF0749 family)